MEVNNNVQLNAGMFALNKAKDVKENQVLSALGMTPQTERAQQEIDNSMKEDIAKATGKGSGIDINA